MPRNDWSVNELCEQANLVQHRGVGSTPKCRVLIGQLMSPQMSRIDWSVNELCEPANPVQHRRNGQCPQMPRIDWSLDEQCETGKLVQHRGADSAPKCHIFIGQLMSSVNRPIRCSTDERPVPQNAAC
jgi:hypothetical protein